MKISFCVTYYNQSRFVAQSLDSILALDMPCSFEILVGDDGSSDDTVAKVKEYQSRFPDRIHLFVMPRENGKEYNPIHRVSENRLNLTEHATGDFIMFLDGDDHYCATDFIPKALSAFERDKSLVACVFGYQFERFGEIRRPRLPHQDISLETYVKCIYIHCGAFVFRRNVFTKERLEFLRKTETFDDNVISLYALQFGNMAYVDEPIYGYQQNESSIWNSASELERDLINAEAFFILSSVAPKFRAWLLKRSFRFIRSLWKRRRGLKTALGEKTFVRHLSGVRRRNDWFIGNCLDWNNLSFPQRLATYAAYLKMRHLVRK